MTTEFAAGLADFDRVMSQFEAGQQDVLNRQLLGKKLAEIRQGLALVNDQQATTRAELQARRAQAEAEALIRPRQTALALSQWSWAERQLPLAQAELDALIEQATRQAQWRKAAYQQDPTGAAWRAYELYVQTFPARAVPMTASGVPDFAAIQQTMSAVTPAMSAEAAKLRTSTYQQAIEKGVPIFTDLGTLRPMTSVQEDLMRATSKETGKTLSDEAQKALVTEAIRQGVSVMDPQTQQLRPFSVIQQELASRAAQERTSLSGQARLEASQQLAGVREMLSRAEDLARRLFVDVGPTGEILSPTPRQNVVGPVVGSWPVRKAMAFAAPERAAFQDEVQRFAADLTREKTATLKGALSNKELKFIQESVAQVTNTEESWRQFLNRLRPTLQAAVQRLSNLLQTGVTPSQMIEYEDFAGASRSLRPGEVVVVDSAAEARSLPKGTPFVTRDGRFSGVVP